MKFTLTKEELVPILTPYVDKLFPSGVDFTVEAVGKGRAGTFLEINVTPKESKPKAKKESPKPLTDLNTLVQEEPEEENNKEVVTNTSLFSKMA